MSLFIQLLTNKLKSISLVALTLAMFILAGCATTFEETPVLNTTPTSSVENEADSNKDTVDENVALTSFTEVSQYIREHQQLPPNYITKAEAKKLGWVASEGNLHVVAPGKSIGGDRFGNREGLLPKASGRTWYEADIDYVSGTRNGKRIVFSNDGLIYMTTDHYATFTNITEEGSVIDDK